MCQYSGTAVTYRKVAELEGQRAFCIYLHACPGDHDASDLYFSSIVHGSVTFKVKLG
jgi:hypothetical protein